jgi:hypothetical protein
MVEDEKEKRLLALLLAASAQLSRLSSTRWNLLSQKRRYLIRHAQGPKTPHWEPPFAATTTITDHLDDHQIVPGFPNSVFISSCLPSHTHWCVLGHHAGGDADHESRTKKSSRALCYSQSFAYSHPEAEKSRQRIRYTKGFERRDKWNPKDYLLTSEKVHKI